MDNENKVDELLESFFPTATAEEKYRIVSEYLADILHGTPSIVKDFEGYVLEEAEKVPA